jgi:predicted DNA-binding transcriptional regulator YafY
MDTEKRIIRIFQLIAYLSHKPFRTKQKLAQIFHTTVRTIERDFEVLERLNYPVDTQNGLCFIVKDIPAEKGVSFTFEETQVLRELLYSDQHPLRDGILRKLFYHSDLHPLSQNLMQAENARKIRELVKAISEKQRVVLRNYHSAHSQSISDRKVEPLEFSDNYESITAFELASQQQKSYKIERIEAVERLDEVQTYQYLSAGTDWFGFIGEQAFTVQLRLSDLAYRRLIEEHPSTKPFVQLKFPNTSHPYHFEGEVRSEIGIGRFILGLPNEIQVLAPQKLKDYLNERIRNLRY